MVKSENEEDTKTDDSKLKETKEKQQSNVAGSSNVVNIEPIYEGKLL